MIFKVITDESTLSGQRIVGALQARKIAQQQATAQLEIDIACLKKYQVACQNGTMTTEQFDTIMHKASVSAVEYSAKIKAGTGTAQSYAQAQKANNSALQSVRSGTDIASKAIKALTVTMNTITITAFSTIVSKGISWITEQIDNYMSRNKIAIEKAEELLGAFKSEVDTITSNQDKISGYADEFRELSEGVDDLGRNVSLTADEYSRYQRMVKEIVGINPSLISGYDEENNVLADKNGLIETSIKLLKDEYNQKLKNLALPNNVDTAINGAIGRYNSAQKNFLEIEIPTALAYSGVKIDENGNRKTGYINQISRYIEDVIGVEFTGWEGGINQYILNNAEAIFNNLDKIKERAAQTRDGWEGLSDSQLIDLMDYLGELHIAYNDMNNAATSANPTLQYVAMAEDSYSELSDIQKKFVADYINGIQITSKTTEQEKDNIRRSIIFLTQELSDLDDAEINKALADLYAIPTDEQSISEFVEQFRNALEVIKAYCKDNGIEIPVAITDNEQTINDLEAQYQHAVDFAKDKFDGYDPTDFFKEHSINTQEEIDAWQEIAEDARDAAEAEKEYIQSSTPNFEPPTPLTITQTVDQISTRLKSAFSSLQSAYQEIFTLDENTGEKQFASLDEVDITDKFQPILDALQDLDELDGINVDYSSYEDFVSVLSDTSSTADEVQEQFDRLATNIIYTSDCTSMSAETFNLLAESLSEMGVSNAYEALNNILTLQQALANEGVNVQTAMSGEIGKLKDLTFASDETAERLMAYYIQKQLAQNPLGTLDDILQLESLCNALGITGEMLETVTALKLAFEAKESGAHAAGLDESIKAYQEKLAGLASGYGTFSFDFNAADTKSSSTSGPASSAKAAAETFDWVSQAIEHVEKEIEELDDTANSSYSTFSEKNEAFAQEIRKVSEEIDLQQQAYENYIQKADAVGLSDHYRALVENGASVMEDISDEALKNQISEYQKWYDKAQETQDKINSLYEKSKDIHVASYENCVQELDTLRDNDSISEREYLDRMSMLWETYYADQTEYAVQAKEAKLELLKREKSYLESVADAASNLLNGQAEELRNRQEAEIEVLEAKKRPLEAQLELLEAQEEKEDRILALQKAQYELKRAEHQRDKLTYVDGQMVYRADEAEIRNTKEAVDDAEYNMVKGTIQDRIDAYDKEIDKVKERYETEIAGIERLENEWQKALALRENALTAGDFESMFGGGSIEKLLSGDSSMISTWRQAYLEALGGIDLTANGTIGEMTARYAELAGLDLSSITEQTMTVASQFHAIHDAVGRLNASIASEPATDTPDSTSAKQTQSSEDSLSLSGALQNTYDIASEVLPEEAEMLHTIAEAANTAAAAIHELKTAIASLSALPLSPDSLTISGNAYASGTRRAQKGLAVIGEEKPEMIITNGQKAFLAKQPTLLRMEGGETVYNGEETERMLKARGFQPVTPEKFPLLKSFASYRPSEIRQRFVPQMISPANTAAASAIQNAGRAVNNSFNNGTSFTTGDVHIHCPGITKDEVAKQIGTELTNVFSGMSLNAYQRVNITR